MSTQVTTAFVQQYSANVQMLSQQMGSRLRDTVRVESMTGKNAFEVVTHTIGRQLDELNAILLLRYDWK